MFTPAVQRIVWKEFRAQRAIWFGIAFELVILQLVRAFSPDKFPINLVSLACVLTGIFAMTSSALLFAGESEAQTDGFLRQLPFRSRDLLLGKLGFNIAAVASFLGFSLLAAMLVNAVQLSGRPQVGEFDETLAYANSILGLWAWGIFYSLLTRKVMWTLLGAALTEVVINAALHGGLKGHWYSESEIYVIYRGIVVVVFLLDAWLLPRWYSRGNVISHSMAKLEVDELTLASTRPLPWAKSWKICSRLGIAYGVVWNVTTFTSFVRAGGSYGSIFPLILLIGTIGAVIGAVVVVGMRTSRLLSSDHSESPGENRSVPYSFQFSNILKQVFRLVGLLSVSIFALALGIYVGMSCVNLLTFGFVDWHVLQDVWLSKGVQLRAPTSEDIQFMVSVSVAATLVGGFVLWGVGRLLDSSLVQHTSLQHNPRSAIRVQYSPRLAIRTLQFAQSTFQSISRSWGSLLWVEARRAVPFLIGGSVILGLTGAGFFWFSRDVGAGLSFWGLLLTSYICGLMTILPDRSQGTLSFLIERGVPAHRILAVKIVVWGLTLTILAVIPILVCFPQWSSLWNRINEDPRNSVSSELLVSMPHWSVSPATQIFLNINTGLFAVGALSAAWIRRPILAVIGGLVGVIVWLMWCVALVENNILLWATFSWPIVLSFIGYFMSGTTTLLEQANWKSKVGRIAWVMLIIGGSLLWLRDFRIHEIPSIEFGEMRKLLVERHVSSPLPMQKPVVIHSPKDLGNVNATNVLWKSLSSSESLIRGLGLHVIVCDLDASLPKIVAGLRANNEFGRIAQTESEFIEAVKVRRLLLSAFRRWTNHSQQTAELLEEGGLCFNSLTRGDQFHVVDLLAHQYVAAMQAVESGSPPTEDIYGHPLPRENPLIRPLLRLSGEQERVRRLVDLQFYDLTSSPLSGEASAGPGNAMLQLSIERWRHNTNLSLDVLGVQLPSTNLYLSVLNEMKLIDVSTQATALVLQLQLWRVRHGQFPASMVEILHDGQLVLPDLFSYEPKGLNRPLRSHAMRVTPMRQPVIYHQGITPIHGIELVLPAEEHEAFYRARSWLMDDARVQSFSYAYFQQSSKDQLARQVQILAEAEGPASPNEIRFVILGRSQDEDRLCLPPEQQVTMSFEKLQEATLRESTGQINPELQGSMSPAAEPATTTPPTPEIPPAPPESQAAESAPE